MVGITHLNVEVLHGGGNVQIYHARFSNEKQVAPDATEKSPTFQFELLDQHTSREFPVQKIEYGKVYSPGQISEEIARTSRESLDTGLVGNVKIAIEIIANAGEQK